MSKIIDRDGAIHPMIKQPVVVDDFMELKNDYVVRLIKDDGCRKSCIAEEIFHNPPNREQIIWCLSKHKEASFAAVSERYRMEEDLPFC